MIADVEKQREAFIQEQETILQRARDLRKMAYDISHNRELTERTRQVESTHYENFANAEVERANRYAKRIRSLRDATAALQIRRQNLLRDAAKFERRHSDVSQ